MKNGPHEHPLHVCNLHGCTIRLSLYLFLLLLLIFFNQITLDSYWRDIRRKIKDDPRYSKFGTSELVCLFYSQLFLGYFWRHNPFSFDDALLVMSNPHRMTPSVSFPV